MHNGEPPPKCIQIAVNVLDCTIVKAAVSSLLILLDLLSQLGPEFWSVSGVVIKGDIMQSHHLTTIISIAVVKQIWLISQAPLPVWAISAWSQNGSTAWNSSHPPITHTHTHRPQSLPFGNPALWGRSSTRTVQLCGCLPYAPGGRSHWS